MCSSRHHYGRGRFIPLDVAFATKSIMHQPAGLEAGSLVGLFYCVPFLVFMLFRGQSTLKFAKVPFGMMNTILRNVRAFTELKDLGDDSGNVDPTVEQVVGGGDTQVSFSLVRVTHLQSLLDAFIVSLSAASNWSI